MAALQFLQPGWLLLLPVCWLLIARLSRGRQPGMWPQTMDAHLYAHLSPAASHHLWQPGYPFALGLLLSLLVTALAGPGWYSEEQPVIESAAARVIVLSLSESMRVQDVTPDRHTQARNAALNLLQTEFDGETGLVVFAGSAFTVAPLTRDANTLRRFLTVLNVDTMPVAGNRLDSGIERANSLLQSAVAGNGHIIAIADGADEPALVTQAIKTSVQRGSRVSIIAIGTEHGGPHPNSDGGLLRDESGRIKMVRTDLHGLAAFAHNGGGEFSTHNRSLSATPAASATKPDAATQQQTRKVDGGFWLVIAALPLALWQFRRNAALLLLAVGLIPAGHLKAQESDSLWFNQEQRAHRAFLRGDFDTAARLTDNAVLKGTASLQLGRYDDAIDLLATAEHSVTARYNRANALVAAKRFDEALQGYREVLQINPKHADALENHERLKLWLAIGQQPGASGDSEESAAEEPQVTGDELETTTRSSRQGEGSDRPVDGEQPGDGAGLSQGRIDAEDKSDGLALELERLLARLEAQGRREDQQWLKQFTDRHASADPAELFKRKFLRDHLRNSERAR